ncbi:MAG: glycosyltransferase family 2 protein, partial [Marinoscillum sp.]
MEYILYVIETGLLAYFAFSALYTLLMAIMSHLDQPMPPTKWSKPRNRICVLIPAYKEDSVIYDTARSAAFNQSYPSNLYEVIVIADQLKPSTIRKLGELPIRVIPVSFEKSTKVKALNAALDQLDDIYVCAVILDADNVMEFTFLEKVSTLYDSSNHKVIQGQRKPKNSQTTLAFLDGVSESINTSIFRRGTSATGLSSAISGSGFAAEFGLLRQELSAMDSIGGFDRELELRFIKKGFNVHYQHDLVVYDEKVSTTSSFENQRKRWISSQYVYLSKYFKEGMLSLLKGDIS